MSQRKREKDGLACQSLGPRAWAGAMVCLQSIRGVRLRRPASPPPNLSCSGTGPPLLGGGRVRRAEGKNASSAVGKTGFSPSSTA